MYHQQEKNPNWKGGISTAFYHKIGKNIPQICYECRSKKNLEFHHIDFNRKNNKINNLKILCRSCHTKIHNKFKNFNILHNPKIIGKCVICGKQFEYWKSVRKNAKYCSDNCRRKDQSNISKKSWTKRKEMK